MYIVTVIVIWACKKKYCFYLAYKSSNKTCVYKAQNLNSDLSQKYGQSVIPRYFLFDIILYVLK